MKSTFMNVTKNNFDEFLIITYRLNTQTSKLSDNEAKDLNSKLKDLKLYFLNKEITHNQISDKRETIINNLAHFK